MAAKAALSALVMATRAAEGGSGAGYGDPPFALQVGHLPGQKIGTSTGYFELSSDDGRPTAGMRPASMLEPWPQGKGERHSGIGYELVQVLDAPVLQMVEQLPNVLQSFVHESTWSTPWLWVRPCDPAATSVSSLGFVTPVAVQRQMLVHGLWLSWGTSSSASSRWPLEEFPVLGVHALFACGNVVHYSSTTLYLAVYS